MSDPKKTPKGLSTDDLMELAFGETKPDDVGDLTEYKNDILSFLHLLGIEPGSFPVNKKTLYIIYKAWSERPLIRGEFIKQVNDIFPNDAAKNIIKLNKNSIKLTHEAYIKFKKQTYILKSAKYAAHFNDFLKYHSIESGKYYIEVDLFYLIYTRYANKKEIKPLSSRSFEKYCRVTFLSKQLLTGPAFAVKENVENFFEPGELKKLRKQYAKKKKRN
jgi:hypothetical protein